MNPSMQSNNIIKKIFNYLLIGGFATGLNYLCFILLFGYIGLDELLSSGTAYMTGLVVSYPLNRKITFKSSVSRTVNFIEISKYISVYLFTLAFGLGFFEVCLMLSQLSPYIIQAVQLVIVTCLNFILLNSVVFKKGSEE